MIEDIRWKFVATFSIIAMAVSLLSGGLGGIRLGTLIVRALIAGVIFAGIGIVLNLFIVRFLPELFTSQEFSSEESPSTGGRVDIVTEDDTETLGALATNIGASSELNGESGERPGGADIDGDRSADDESEAVEELDGPSGDLDSFSGTFGEVQEETPSKSTSTTELLGSEHDPEEIAQAIHTVINRDEKG